MAKAKLYQWPPPVYVARFANGEECRMSVSSTIKGQYGFDRARRIACGVIGNERGRARVDVSRWRFECFEPAADLVDGYFEHDGEIIPDPAFLPTGVIPPKAKADPLVALLVKLRKLDLRDLDKVQAIIDERLAA